MLILLSRESDKTLRIERVESKLAAFVLRVFIHLLLVRNSPNRDNYREAFHLHTQQQKLFEN